MNAVRSVRSLTPSPTCRRRCCRCCRCRRRGPGARACQALPSNFRHLCQCVVPTVPTSPGQRQAPLAPGLMLLAGGLLSSAAALAGWQPKGALSRRDNVLRLRCVFALLCIPGKSRLEPRLLDRKGKAGKQSAKRGDRTRGVCRRKTNTPVCSLPAFCLLWARTNAACGR